MNWIALISICILFSMNSYAQELNLGEAVEIALENNYGIRIARNQEQIASNMNTYGNAGFLPTLGTTASYTYTSNNTNQQYFSGDERSASGAGNNSARFAAELRWTAFDGFQMFAIKERLELEEERSRAFTRRAMHELVAEVQNAYYQIVRIRQQQDIIEQSIYLNQSLLDLARNRVEIGSGTQLEVLQTRNVLSADSAALLNNIDQLKRSKINLNRLLRREVETEYTVSGDWTPAVLPNEEELYETAIAQNYDLQLLSYDEQIALAQIKEARSVLYPTLDLNLGYTYNYSKAEVGFLLSNRTYGPSIGVTATYDIFQGRNLKKEIQNAQLFKENINLSKDELMKEIKANLSELFQEYTALGDLIALEERNVVTAERNSQLATQLYQVGRSTDFEVREAILAEARVRDRLSDVQYRRKVAEINLKTVAGIPLAGI